LLGGFSVDIIIYWLKTDTVVAVFGFIPMVHIDVCFKWDAIRESSTFPKLTFFIFNTLD